jgi:hypothetical protein
VKIERFIDSNLKTDYGRVKMLLNKPQNIEYLETIIETGTYPTTVTDRFSIEKIHEAKNFLSLLYYMGLVTVDKDEKYKTPIIKIPNYTIKTMYWEFMENIILERNPKVLYLPHIIFEGLLAMAFENNYKLFFENFMKNFVSQLSNRDLDHFSEKNIKLFLLSILFQADLYLPISETENSKGYSDIYLQRRDYLYPGITTDWVWELKYVKQSDAERKESKKIITAKKKEAKEQIQRYKTSNLFKDRTDVRYLMIIFVGKNKYEVSEL